MPLLDAVKAEALPAIQESNYLASGPEASRISAWIRTSGPRITLHQDTLYDDAGGRLPVSEKVALALARLNQWYGLTAATLAHPISHEELEAAALSPASVERVAHLFEDSIRSGVPLGEKWLVPETGGEATLDAELQLCPMPDPTWSVVRELARESGDPVGVAALCERHPAEMVQLDASNLLRSAIARWRLGHAHAAENVTRAATVVTQNASQAYSLGPDAQFALIASTEWCGRYVGRWHTHPPHYQKGGWAGGDIPSFEDMQNAVRDGQFLTVSFQPEGFDLYDAAPLADAGRVDLSLLKVTSYRSPAWRERFRALHAVVTQGVKD